MIQTIQIQTKVVTEIQTIQNPGHNHSDPDQNHSDPDPTHQDMIQSINILIQTIHILIHVIGSRSRFWSKQSRFRSEPSNPLSVFQESESKNNYISKGHIYKDLYISKLLTHLYNIKENTNIQ